MKIGIVNRKNVEKWGGGWLVQDRFFEGLKDIGQDVIMGSYTKEVLDADFILLSGSVLDLKEEYEVICAHHKSSGIMAFHEDYNFFSTGWGFAYFIGLCLAGIEDNFPLFYLDRILEDPEIVK